MLTDVSEHPSQLKRPSGALCAFNLSSPRKYFCNLCDALKPRLIKIIADFSAFHS